MQLTDLLLLILEMETSVYEDEGISIQCYLEEYSDNPKETIKLFQSALKLAQEHANATKRS